MFSWREAWRRSSLPRCDQEAPRQLQKSPEGRHSSRWGEKMSPPSRIDNKENIWESVLSKLETGERTDADMVFRSTFMLMIYRWPVNPTGTGSHELITQLWCWATISCSQTEILAIVTQQLAKQILPSAGSGWNNREPRCLVLTEAKVLEIHTTKLFQSCFCHSFPKSGQFYPLQAQRLFPLLLSHHIWIIVNRIFNCFNEKSISWLMMVNNSDFTDHWISD